MRSSWSAMVCVLALGACETAPPGSGTAQVTPLNPQAATFAAVTPSITLANDAAGLDGPSIDTVKPALADNLFIRVKLPSVVGLSSLKVTFYNQLGERFYERDFAFSEDPAFRSLRMPAGHMLDVAHPKQIQGGWALDVAIPIVGTTFDRYGAAGNWKVTAEADVGDTGSTTLTRPFVLDFHK